MTNPYENYQPKRNTAAPIENRMSALFSGDEAFFTDEEAREVIAAITTCFNHVVIVRNCPKRGFTRISACNLRVGSGVVYAGNPL